MIALVPMMGLGERFARNGYSEYKPFVKVNGVPLIKLVLEPLMKRFKKVYVACSPEVTKQLQSLYNDEIHFIVLNNPTRGAAETVLQACGYLPGDQQIACVDCDTIFSQEAIGKIPLDINALMTFQDKDKTGLYSYVQTKNDLVTDIAEKLPISTTANAGIYVFACKSVAVKCCNMALKLDGEFYLSRAIKEYIKETGSQFKCVDVTGGFNCCGTPAQLKEYAKATVECSKRRICFDIDGTLVYDLWDNPKPIQKNVDFCNEMYHAGHNILLNTSRGMLSKDGDELQVESQREKIVAILEDCGILYHDLRFMKPYADLYIDDKAVSAHRDLEKETGFYLFADHTPRAHHKITMNGNTVTKTGDLSGEYYYYTHMPEKIKRFFPILVSGSKSELVLQKISKPTYSSLLMCGRLTNLDIGKLIANIQTIQCSIKDIPQANYYWPYTDKVLERLKEHKEFYTALGINVQQYEQLVYEVDGVFPSVVHGDPVFTNIFDCGGDCKFIDMRGKFDGKETLFADADYDYAKILQSLYGYDYVLNGEEIQHRYLVRLREAFWQDYPNYVEKDELIIKTKLLYVSLLPLHKDNLERCKRFVEILNSI